MAQTLYQMVSAVPPDQYDLRRDRLTRIGLRVDKNSEIMFSISLEFAKESWREYGVRYSYSMKSDNDTLRKGGGIINQDSLDIDSSATENGGSVVVEKRFVTLVLAPGQKDLTISVELEQLHKDQATLVSAQGNVYRDPPRFKMSFISTVMFWIIGILLVLIGAIQWIQGIAAVPVQSDSVRNEESERLWIVSCHLSALLGYIVPFGHIIAPLMIWVKKRDPVPGVDRAGRESLNFQLTVTLLVLIAVMLSVVFIGLVLLFVIIVFHVAMTLHASLKAQRGIDIAYPLNIRMIKPISDE